MIDLSNDEKRGRLLKGGLRSAWDRMVSGR